MPFRLEAVKIIATFTAAISANLSECIITMAKARVSTNPMYTGGAGGYSFYVRGGEQVVRQRKNNSNYGESASRTYPQMERRVRWANLVNFYKAMSFWQPKAYETKAKGQTDYNVFMSLNINGSVVGLTKEMALNGCSVVEGYDVSRGSLPSLQAVGNVVQNGWAWNINLTITIGSSTTVGQLSADIIANNPEFRQGDNLAFIIFKNTKTVNGFPYVSCIYSELTLDSGSTKVLQSINLMDRLVKSSQNTLGATFGASGSKEAGGVLIHTRKVDGSLQVSSQKILTTNENIVDEFSSVQWIDECIASYGLDTEVPLDPSFSRATITSVTANGSAVNQGDSLTGSQRIRVSGANLNGSNFRLVMNGLSFAPYEIGDDYIDYVLSDDGDVRLYLNGRFFMYFSISGVVAPSALSRHTRAFQSDGTAVSGELTQHNVMVVNEYVLQYPYMATNDWPNFFVGIRLDAEEYDPDLFSVSNGVINERQLISNEYRFNLTPIDGQCAVIVYYDNYVVFAGNF